jgi:hypothetical protein
LAKAQAQKTLRPSRNEAQGKKAAVPGISSGATALMEMFQAPTLSPTANYERRLIGFSDKTRGSASATLGEKPPITETLP